MDDVELTVGEMCNTVKNSYGDETGGFIAGQVFKYSGFVSTEGSLNPESNDQRAEDHVAIITYWNSFEQHEHSHADETFKQKFGALAELCDDTYELGYDMMWQGNAED